MDRKIRVGVIGVGFIGAAHVEALRRLNNVDVVAIADHESTIAAKAEQLGIEKYYSDYKELIDKAGVDCVHICTPNHLHYKMCKYALNAGKHVVCEKPLTNKKEEAEELNRLARDKGLVNAVNLNIRFYPLMHQIKAAVQQGEIGEVFSVNGSYLQDWLFYETDYNWRVEPDQAGDSRVVGDIGTHWMDLIEFITGHQITEVMADFATFHKIRKKPLKAVETYSGKMLKPEDYADIPINTEDYASVLLRFSNGARGTMTLSQVFAGRKNEIAFNLAGSKKSVSWVSERPNEIWLGRRDTANESLLKDPSLMHPEGRDLVNYPGGHCEGFPDTFKQLFMKVYSKIAGKSDKVEYPEFTAGLREISLCEKIIESNKTGCWVKI